MRVLEYIPKTFDNILNEELIKYDMMLTIFAGIGITIILFSILFKSLLLTATIGMIVFLSLGWIIGIYMTLKKMIRIRKKEIKE